MQRNFFIYAVAVIGFLSAVNATKILAIFPFQAKSHYKVYEPLLIELAERGHQVHAVTHFPQKIKRVNFTDIDISPSLPSLISNLPLQSVQDFTIWKNTRYLMRYAGVDVCQAVFNNSKLHKLISSKDKYDMLIVEIFATDCLLGISHVLKIPRVVGVITSVALPWSNDILRNPENPSYIPYWFSSYTDRMNFYERLTNTIGLLASKISYRILSDWPSYEIAKKYLGEDLPDLDELRSKFSLILTNGHLAVGAARPLVPAFKDIGGIHIPISGPDPLVNDLKDYLDSFGQHGVIYFSMGSQIDPASMNQVFTVLYTAFERVPQQILWSCDPEKMPDLPKNVKCIGWAPQLSILCHPNVRLFISHGGLLGTQEAVYCGVPILGMPLFGDQYLNMAYSVQKGFALQNDFRRLTLDNFSDSLNQLLTNKSYVDAAKRASSRFNDRPIAALHEAAFWVEYVLRHGSESLKTSAPDLEWYQFYLLDVALAIVLLSAIPLWMLHVFLKLFLKTLHLLLKSFSRLFCPIETPAAREKKKK
ncbi:UDP-glycosyltransferase UGT5-like [Prorops nasuta]|uniref:UDP-glycosyltransferase UGT5-like n=1 Tax=Prorops nasuta TaxID=863751 RepID=UPI0034CD299E